MTERDETPRNAAPRPVTRRELAVLCLFLLFVGGIYLATLPAINSNDGNGYILAFEGNQPFIDFLGRIDPLKEGAPRFENLGPLHPHHLITNGSAYLAFSAWRLLGGENSARVPWMFTNVLWTLAMLGACYLLLRRYVGPGSALGGIALVAFSSGQWTLATSAEVYQSAAFSIALQLLYLDRVLRSERVSARQAFFLGLLNAFAALVHSINFVLMFPIAAVIALKNRPRQIVICGAIYGATLWGVSLFVLGVVAFAGAGAQSLADALSFAFLHPYWLDSDTVMPFEPALFVAALWKAALHASDLVAYPAGASSILLKLVLGALALVAPVYAVGAIRRRARARGERVWTVVVRGREPQTLFFVVAAAVSVFVAYIAHWDWEARDYSVVAAPLVGILWGGGLGRLSESLHKLPRAVTAGLAIALVAALAAHAWVAEISPQLLTREEAAELIVVSRIPETTPGDLILLNRCINDRERWWIFHELHPEAPVGEIGWDMLPAIRRGMRRSEPGWWRGEEFLTEAEVEGLDWRTPAPLLDRIRAVTGTGGSVYVAMTLDHMETAHCQPEWMFLSDMIESLGEEPGLAVTTLLDVRYQPGPELNTWYSHRIADALENRLYRISRPDEGSR